MSDYLKGVIYKLHKDDMTEIYIGSTADEIEREKNHKSDCNNENGKTHYNLKVYKFIRENGGIDTWKFEVIERFPCENETQLVIRERYHYDLLKPALNTIRPYISEEERKEHKAQLDAKFYQKNKEEILKRDAKRYQDNKGEILKQKAKHYQDNRDKILKQIAKHYQDNIKRMKQKHDCGCGGRYTIGDKAKHCKTNKHIAFIENQKLK
jgi:hypothetical protein